MNAPLVFIAGLVVKALTVRYEDVSQRRFAVAGRHGTDASRAEEGHPGCVGHVRRGRRGAAGRRVAIDDSATRRSTSTSTHRTTR